MLPQQSSSDLEIVRELGIGEGHLFSEGEELEAPLATLTGTEMEGSAIMAVERDGEIDVEVGVIPDTAE